MALTLYHIAPSRSSSALWMLEEIGEPFEIHLLSMKRGENREPAYLAINPMGKVPAIDHDGTIVTESAAVLTYLADAFPGAGLAPRIGDKRRGPYLKWMFFAPGVLEPAAFDRMMPRKEPPLKSAIGYGDFETVMDVLAKAVAADTYLLGSQFSAADVLIAGSLRYMMYVKAIPPRAEFAAYVERCFARPAAKRATAKDQELSVK